MAELASQEDGFNELLRISFDAMMKAVRKEHLSGNSDDKGNGFRQVKAYSRAKCFGYTRGFKPDLLTQAAVFPRLQADLETLEMPPKIKNKLYLNQDKITKCFIFAFSKQNELPDQARPGALPGLAIKTVLWERKGSLRHLLNGGFTR